MSIIPLEAVITYIKSNSGVQAQVGTQVASKHQFGSKEGNWAIPSKAIQVQPSPGPVDVDTPVEQMRLEVRCYGGSQYEAFQVYTAFRDLVRTTERVTVDTTTGKALIYKLLLDASPSLLYDPEVGIDLVMVFAQTAVAEQEVP